METQPVIIPEPDLEKVMPVVEALEDALSCRIVLTMQAVVTSADKRALAALQQAFGDGDAFECITAVDEKPETRGRKPEPKKRGGRGKALTIKPNGNGSHASSGGSHSGGPRGEYKAWRVFRPGEEVVSEWITVTEKDRRLQAGEFPAGTVIHHPKSGRQLVTGALGEPQRLVPAANGSLYGSV